MKKLFYFSIAAITLLFSCTKQSSKPIVKPAILVSHIASNDLDFPNSETLTDFTYSNEMLTTVLSRHSYGSPLTVDETNTNFSYNTNGQLKETSIDVTRGYQQQDTDVVKSVVTYLGKTMRTIAFYERNGDIHKTFTLNYQNGLLTQLSDLNTVNITYTYDINNNNIKAVIDEYKNGKATSNQKVYINHTFDTKINFQQSLPLWVYFKCYRLDQSNQSFDIEFDNQVLGESLTFSPGKNNPLKISSNGKEAVYSYEYDFNGYPSTITYPGKFSNKYTYIQAN